MGTKARKKKIIPEEFDSIYRAEKAILRANYKKNHLIDLTLSSPRIEISQSKIIIIDNRGTKKNLLEATKTLPRFIIIKNAKAKDRETWIPFNI